MALRLFTPVCVLIAFAVAAYVWLAHAHVSPYAADGASAKYYNHAVLLARGETAAAPRTLPGLPPDLAPHLYSPLGFTVPVGGSPLIPASSPGLPLLTAATAAIAGWDWVIGWTAGWNLLLAILLCYPLGRVLGLAAGWAFFGTLLLALNPLTLASGLAFSSDIPALAWCEATILFTLLARRQAAWFFAAGIAFVLAVLIRPTNALLLLPLALLVIPRFSRRAPSPRRNTVLLALWSAPFLVLYSLNEFTVPTRAALPLLLPAFPPLLIAALTAAQHSTLLRQRPLFVFPNTAARHAASALLVTAVIVGSTFLNLRLDVFAAKADASSAFKTAAWLNRHAPGGTCVLALRNSGSLFAYTPYTVLRWDTLNVQTQPLVAAALAHSRRPLYAALHASEEADAFTRFPGNWREVYSHRQLKVWFLEPAAPARPES